LTDYDGTVIVDEAVSPHDELIRFMDRKIKDYCKRLKALEEHPLFKESLDMSKADLLDLIDKAFALSYELRGDFPEAFFFTRSASEDTLIIPDDGSASFLLNIGKRILNIMKAPYLTKVRMRNIFYLLTLAQRRLARILMRLEVSWLPASVLVFLFLFLPSSLSPLAHLLRQAPFWEQEYRQR